LNIPVKLRYIFFFDVRMILQSIGHVATLMIQTCIESSRVRLQPASVLPEAAGGGAPSCIIILEKVVSRCGFNVEDMLPVRRQNLMLKREVLGVTGKSLAAGANPED
jgi:hypothetical protein